MPRHESSMTRLLWEPWLGEESSLIRMEFLGRKYIRVQRLIKDAVLAMEQVLRNTGYEDPTDFVGSYFYRTIGGLNVWSTHAYGVALDVDYGYIEPDRLVDKNPHLHRHIYPGDEAFGNECQITEEQVLAIEAIKNTHGEQMWAWKGWSIGDTMHWQINVRPDRTTVDWDTVVAPPGPPEEEELVPRALFEQWLRVQFAAGILEGDVEYWIQLIDDPENPEWAHLFAVVAAKTVNE